jgi:hypothetical protein
VRRRYLLAYRVGGGGRQAAPREEGDVSKPGFMGDRRQHLRFSTSARLCFCGAAAAISIFLTLSQRLLYQHGMLYQKQCNS